MNFQLDLSVLAKHKPVNIEIDLSKQPDLVMGETPHEAPPFNLRQGLLVPEVAGEDATAIDEPLEPDANLREQLLGSLEVGARLYGSVIAGINARRGRKAEKLPTLSLDEYQELATHWLTDRRLVAAENLPATKRRPRLLVPRLNRAITTEENLKAWGKNADKGVYTWRHRLKFIAHWTANDLSGFDPELAQETPFEIIPTAYDTAREGTVAHQNRNLEKLTFRYPELGIAPIFAGVVLARYFKGHARDWEDTLVKDIKLRPAQVEGVNYVPCAGVDISGKAGIFDSYVGRIGAARLIVR